LVGVVLRPAGLKGELKIKAISDNPDRFSPGGRLWFVKGGEPSAFVIKSAREQKDNVVVWLDGVDSIEVADGFRGLDAFVPESEVPPLPEGEYYHYQILGLPVYTQGGRLLGKVEDIFTAGEKDVYVVRGDGEEYLVPVNDDSVEEIDVKKGLIRLKGLEGYIPE